MKAMENRAWRVATNRLSVSLRGVMSRKGPSGPACLDVAIFPGFTVIRP